MDRMMKILDLLLEELEVERSATGQGHVEENRGGK